MRQRGEPALGVGVVMARGANILTFGEDVAAATEAFKASVSESWGVCQRYVERVSGIIARLVVEGVETGDFTVEDPVVGGLCVHSAMVCFCHPAMIAQSSDQPKPTVDQIVAFALRGLGARETS